MLLNAWLLVLQQDYDSLALLREAELTITQNGGTFVSLDDGYSISVPSGAVPTGSTNTIRHGVVPHGAFHNFRFPQGVYPVSSIICLQSTTELELLKPFDIALPHFINCDTPEECMKLTVFKACCTHIDEVTSSYQFEPIPNESLSLYSYRSKESNQVIPYVSCSSDLDFYCLWCVCTYTSYDADKAMFCLIEAKQKQSTEKGLTIHYCLPYYLPTCIKV